MKKSTKKLLAVMMCAAMAGSALAGCSSCLLYTSSDPDLIKFNVTCRVTKVLEDAGLAYEIYSDIKPNPCLLYTSCWQRELCSAL